MKKTAFSTLLLVTCACAAQAGDAPQDGWHFLVEPYVMFPHMKGEAGIGDRVRIHVDEDPQDIFDNLQIGAMLFFEARNDTWAFSSDLLYMDLEADIRDDEGTLGVSQLGWELAAMRRIAPWFELGLGLTYNRIEVDAHLDLAFGQGTSLDFGMTEDWIDPTMVARATLPIGDRWFFQARANLGGFGIGHASELNWQIQADLGYQPSEKWRFSFGYRVIDIDYDQGSGGDRFVYDVRTFGPILRLGYRF